MNQDRFSLYLCTLHRSHQNIDMNCVRRLLLEFKSFQHPSIIGCLATLVHYIKKYRIQIVHTYFQDPTLLAAISRPFHNARLVGSFRDLGFWRNYKETLKMRIAYHAYSGFVANSKAVKDHFVQFDGVAPDKIEIIYNGISAVKLKQQGSANLKNESPIIGIVANLNRPVKRVQDFIHAAAMVRRARPEARFFVVGDGHLRPELEALSKTLGLAEALTFTGLVQNPFEIICGFDVGVITSETEGFCNAILEYMACGVPVVATAVGGNFELVRDGENGFLVPVGEVKWIAEKIEMLLRDDALRARMREANMQRVAIDFTLSKMVANHESFYGKILTI